MDEINMVYVYRDTSDEWLWMGTEHDFMAIVPRSTFNHYIYMLMVQTLTPA